jgi:hypothetical protein
VNANLLHHLPGLDYARELVRCHDAGRRDLMTAHHRVSKLLVRHGIVYPSDDLGRGRIGRGWRASALPNRSATSRC